MINALTRLLAPLLLTALAYTLTGCANGEVRGNAVEPPLAGGRATPVGTVLVVVVNQAVLTTTGLASLRAGAKKYLVNDTVLDAMMRTLRGQLRDTLEPNKVAAVLSSELAMSGSVRPSHTVIVSPQTVKKSPTATTVDIAIVIRDEVAGKELWRGEATLVQSKASVDRASSGIVLAMQQYGLIGFAP